MRALRGEERWAARMIEAELDCSVLQHDDGSLPRMYDLDVVLTDERRAAVEVTAAGDQEAIEQWNLMNGGERWIVPHLAGGWLVEVRMGSRWKKLETELPSLLAELEALTLPTLRVHKWTDSDLVRRADNLGVVAAFQSETSFPGSVYMTFDMPTDRAGGFIGGTQHQLAAWVSAFLRDPRCSDVLHKLASANAAERHAFIILPGFNTAPFAVNDLLLRSEPALPTTPPSLPGPLTHLWIASTWSSGVGMRWTPRGGWLTFDKLVDEEGIVTV